MKTHVFYIHGSLRDSYELAALAEQGAAPDLRRYRFVTSLSTEMLDRDGALSFTFRAMNVVDGTELPTQLQVRSMSVGDIALVDGSAWVCAPVGWSEVADPDFVNGLEILTQQWL